MHNQQTPGNTHHVATLFAQSQNVSRTTMSSREIAEFLHARHDNVKRTIERLSEKTVVRFTPSEETSHEGPGSRPMAVYLVNKRDSFVVVAQLSPEFTAALVDRWQELESEVFSYTEIPTSFAEALRLAADQAEQNQLLQQVIAKQAPKVDALHRLAKTQSDVCITTAAQILGVRPTKLFSWLNQNRWIHRRTVHSSWVAYQPRLTAGVLKHKLVKVGGGEGLDIKVVEQVMVTRSGIVKLAEQLQGITL
jgi:phage regulator Rha-like protein